MYINGNYIVRKLPGGGIEKRALRVGENFNPIFPDSIDLKITNSCSEGCPFCHESSVPGGRSFNLDRTIQILSSLPRYPIEIAIGGGNVFDCLDDTVKLVGWMLNYGFEPRVTISYSEFSNKVEPILKDQCPRSFFNVVKPTTLEEQLCCSVPYFGVSTMKYVPKIYDRDVVVWHVIVGITPVGEVKKMLEDPYHYGKILFLGMKQFGRSKDWKKPDLTEWKTLMKEEVFESKGNGKVIGFDNLALEQLEIKKNISSDKWNSLWFGPEFSSSMYVDAVEETYAPTSTSSNRVAWSEYSLVDYFKKYKNDFSN